MSDINIPGVTDSYKTKDLISSLMKVEQIPRDRAKESLDEYKGQQTMWRTINQQMSKLRESARSLYSYNNPFSEKLASSTDEAVLTATVTKDASFETAKFNIEKIATADRFLSREFAKNDTVPAGNYKFTVADKSLLLSWKGGSVSDFAAAINRRSNNLVKASVIGISRDAQALIIESLKTGSENRLIFEDAALDFALNTGIIEKEGDKGTLFGFSVNELRTIPELGKREITADNGIITVPPQNGAGVPLPASGSNLSLEFSVSVAKTHDITDTGETPQGDPILSSSGSATFKGIRIDNINSETGLAAAEPAAQQKPVTDFSVLYIKKKDGTEQPIARLSDSTSNEHITLNLADYPSAESLIVKNNNTGRSISLSGLHVYDPSVNSGYKPVNPVETAADAKFKYQGITVTRSSNEVDDLIPGVTLQLQAPSDKQVSLTIKPDEETAKEAIIAMVGNYNRLIAELNILTQQKPEIIAELDYLTEEEQEAAEKRLGMFTGDFTLTNEKNSLQGIMSNSYKTVNNSPIILLEQIGISTKSGSHSGYSASQYRGYLEIDEKKLNEALKNNMDAVKDLFGNDSNGDLIIDSGVALSLDKNLQSFVQVGGIIATKTSSLDTKVRTTEAQVKKLDEQLAVKEQELKRKYGTMEGTLNNLQSQSSSINNFSNQNNR